MDKIFSAARNKYSDLLDWDDAPPITLSAWRKELKEHNKTSPGIVFKSSGTAGNNSSLTYPKFVMEGASKRAKQLLEKTSLSPLNRVAIFFGYGLFPPASFYTTALLDMKCFVLPMGSGRNLSSEKKTEWIANDPINAIVSMPSYLLRFSYELVKRELLRNVKKNLKCLITGGEILYPSLRKRLEDIFEVPIYDHYGMLEAPMIAGECLYARMHVCNDYFPEVRTSLGIRNNGYGSLILSSINVWPGVPMIRIDTGDIIDLISTIKCECGDNSPFIQIHGRNDYQVKTRGYQLDLNAIFERLNHIGILEYQLIIRYDEQLREVLILNVDTDIPINQIPIKMTDLIPFTMTIIKDPTFVTKSRNSGKAIRFIDERQQ